MGNSSESEVWDLSLRLEGLSLRLSRTRIPNPLPSGTPAAVPSSRQSSPSGRSTSSFSVVFGVPASADHTLPCRTPGLATGRALVEAPPPPLKWVPCPHPSQTPRNHSAEWVCILGSPCRPPPWICNRVESPSAPLEGLVDFTSSASAVPEYPLPGPRPALTFKQRQRLALAFPPVPDTCIVPSASATLRWSLGLWSPLMVGSVELLEFSWLPPSLDQDQFICWACVVTRRPQGFLLCIPEGFLSAEELEQGSKQQRWRA